jgi:NADH:ubiquinone oxidoreductase subunit 6 (subunit J)
VLTFVLLGILFTAEILSALAVVFMKGQVHAAVAITAFFSINTAIFFLLGQSLLGVIQFLILVGGISTYLLLGTGASDEEYFKHTSIATFVLVLIPVFAILSYPFLSQGGPQLATIQPSAQPLSQLGFQLLGGTSMIYLASLLLFAAAIGAVMLLKRRY